MSDKHIEPRVLHLLFSLLSNRDDPVTFPMPFWSTFPHYVSYTSCRRLSPPVKKKCRKETGKENTQRKPCQFCGALLWSTEHQAIKLQENMVEKDTTQKSKTKQIKRMGPANEKRMKRRRRKRNHIRRPLSANSIIKFLESDTSKRRNKQILEN